MKIISTILNKCFNLTAKEMHTALVQYLNWNFKKMEETVMTTSQS